MEITNKEAKEEIYEMIRLGLLTEEEEEACHLLYQALERLEQTQTADVVEVVRCKDCIHCAPDPLSKGLLMCTNEQWYIEFPPSVDPDFFCKGGERKKDNDR